MFQSISLDSEASKKFSIPINCLNEVFEKKKMTPGQFQGGGFLSILPVMASLFFTQATMNIQIYTLSSHADAQLTQLS